MGAAKGPALVAKSPAPTDRKAFGDPPTVPEPFPGASCVDCHASADNAVSEQQCYGCHGRQAMEAKRLQLPDVHRDAGMVCWACHKEIDMHGDGSPRTSMLETGAVVECVADEDPRAFIFEEQRLRWRDEVVSTDEIAACRAALARSFGSCSLDEPREDLRGLGLM